MKLSLDERHVRLEDFESRVAGLEFSPEVWTVLARLDQARSAAEVAPLAGLAPELVAQAFDRLVAAKLIRKAAAAMGWAEFAARPAAPAPAAPAKPAATGSAVSLRLGPAPVPPVVSIRLARGEGAPDSPAWRLRPVLDAISAKGGGGIPGQLLVYKVFLQVPADLLKASGIESVNTVSDSLVVRDVRLRSAIIEAARQHAGIDVAPIAV